MRGDYQIGSFRGRKLIQRRGSVGGAKSVFVKLQGNKNELVYPTFGGVIKNPFKGAAKMFAGDLCEFRTDTNGVNPEVYLLKTYLVESVSEDFKTISIVKDAYKHIPFIGDKLGVSPDTIGGDVTAGTIISVKIAKVNGVDVWTCTFDTAITGTTKGNILVEADSEGKMLVKNINAVMDSDIDMLDEPATGDEDYDGARYVYTPALGGIMYLNKMSPIPSCVLPFNKSNINGWFQIQSV